AAGVGREREVREEGGGEGRGRERLQGRRVLVVGAGTRRTDDPDAPIGNGRAIAVLAAREGAVIACADRDESAAVETAQRIAADGGRAEVLAADVTRPEDCAAVVAGAEARLGGLDGLVLNVGLGESPPLHGTRP